MAWLVEQLDVGEFLPRGLESPLAQICAVQVCNRKSRRWRPPLQSLQALDAFGVAYFSCPPWGSLERVIH